MPRRKMARPRYDEYGGRSRLGAGDGGKKLMILGVVILAGILGYWYFNPAAAPDWAREYLPNIRSSTVYKWTDDQGQLQYTVTAPSDRPYEKMDYWENANVIPPNPPPE